jgi:hypothetical protein
LAFTTAITLERGATARTRCKLARIAAALTSARISDFSGLSPEQRC